MVRVRDRATCSSRAGSRARFRVNVMASVNCCTSVTLGLGLKVL
jgi:hypothetical protein